MNLKKLFPKLLTVALLGAALQVSAATTDGEILDVIKTANNAEISAAEVAAKNASSPKVREFANEMVKAHSKNNSEVDKVSKAASVTPATSVSSTSLKSDAESKLSELKKQPVNSRAFDKTYVDQQVAMHQTLLNDLNNTLIPGAQNTEVKSLLQSTRNHVEQHLAKATKLQSEL